MLSVYRPLSHHRRDDIKTTSANNHHSSLMHLTYINTRSLPHRFASLSPLVRFVSPLPSLSLSSHHPLQKKHRRNEHRRYDAHHTHVRHKGWLVAAGQEGRELLCDGWGRSKEVWRNGEWLPFAVCLVGRERVPELAMVPLVDGVANQLDGAAVDLECGIAVGLPSRLPDHPIAHLDLCLPAHKRPQACQVHPLRPRVGLVLAHVLKPPVLTQLLPYMAMVAPVDAVHGPQWVAGGEDSAPQRGVHGDTPLGELHGKAPVGAAKHCVSRVGIRHGQRVPLAKNALILMEDLGRLIASEAVGDESSGLFGCGVGELLPLGVADELEQKRVLVVGCADDDRLLLETTLFGESDEVGVCDDVIVDHRAALHGVRCHLHVATTHKRAEGHRWLHRRQI
mmetsp:Transcript_40742/g.101862  ORF Transcript_40742/g.101862 Transcript_40742/m.101862 type:complete len:394 (+) Transcript_40742:1145-2326(+)